MTLQIGASRVTHRDVARVARRELAVALTREPAWVARMRADRAAVVALVERGLPFYGVNTGFGAAVINSVGAEFGAELAVNLFRFHGTGIGPKFAADEVRAILVTRLSQLAVGWSGVRLEVLEAITALLAHDILPAIPELGSVGASGDLTPMSYVAAVISGEREVHVAGRELAAADALAAAGLAPITLQHKEALSIMNGTSVMTALVALALDRAETFVRVHARATAWTSWLLRGQAAHFDERLFLAKPHPGAIEYAAWVRTALDAGARPEPHPGKVQDPYSVRCAPHVTGVLLEVLAQAEATLAIELNSAGDNPLIADDTGTVLHGGNFYGSQVTHVADTMKLQLAHAAEVLERQLVLLCHAPAAAGIPVGLVRVAGPNQTAHHGFKAVDILAAALVAEAMKLAAPASAFSRSTEGHNQDKVPMGALAARDLRTIQSLSDHVLAISLLACAQATDATGRAEELPAPLAPLYAAIRAVAPSTDEDRRHDGLIQAVVAALHAGAFTL
ncbi:MAG: aromatic amino acid ammonia-lyase [Kofleriaceae bacterium]